MHKHYKDFMSTKPDSLKNLFGKCLPSNVPKSAYIFTGQIARDMRNYGLKYGFVSTYNETIFLKIEQRNDGSYCLQFSPIIKHTVTTGRNSRGDKLLTISLRLCMLYMFALVSDDDATNWSFDPETIGLNQWVGPKHKIPADLHAEDATPRTDPTTRMKFLARPMRESTSAATLQSWMKKATSTEEAFRRRRKRSAAAKADVQRPGVATRSLGSGLRKLTIGADYVSKMEDDGDWESDASEQDDEDLDYEV
jgi:hypothetical protein